MENSVPSAWGKTIHFSFLPLPLILPNIYSLNYHSSYPVRPIRGTLTVTEEHEAPKPRIKSTVQFKLLVKSLVLDTPEDY